MTIGFEVKIEVLAESIISSITSEEWLQHKKRKLEKKLQRKREKLEAEQNRQCLLSKVAPCVVKRMEERKERKIKSLYSEYEELSESESRRLRTCSHLDAACP